ncbi:MAG: hypothetical protein MI861_19730, partial [Pirellulales bacterium]|nr:hypothetical protein [Pirellulales bacterium]
SEVTRSAFGWLDQGDYILRFTALSRVGAHVNAIEYSLTADGVSDDQNPNPDENDPDYDPYAGYYYYEGYDPIQEPPPEEDNYYVYDYYDYYAYYNYP